MILKRKKIAWLSLLLVLLMATDSCKKDETTDPCEGVICLNQGFCVTGKCYCPEGYTGLSCEKQVAPKKIRITEVEFLKIPALDTNGNSWDSLDGPDIYLLLADVQTQYIIHEQSYYIENADVDSVYVYVPSPFIVINEPKHLHSIGLFDYEMGVGYDTYMGEVPFYPYYRNNGFPKTLDIEFESMAFRLHFSYEW